MSIIFTFPIVPIMIAGFLFFLAQFTTEMHDKFSEKFYEKHLNHGEMSFSQFAYLFHGAIMLMVGCALLIVSLWLGNIKFAYYGAPLVIWWAWRAVMWSEFIASEKQKAIEARSTVEREKDRFKENNIDNMSFEDIVAHCKQYVKDLELQK